MKTIIVWYRNDLRVHDHPALSIAAQDADHVVPVFILNDTPLHGKRAGSNRNRFLLESLEDLKQSFKTMGADLVISEGESAEELKKLAEETKAEAVYYTADFSPVAIKRDKVIAATLHTANIQTRAFPGRLIVSSLDKLKTKTSATYKVFTPFWKNWEQVQRREVASKPNKLSLPSTITIGKLPKLVDITTDADLSPNVIAGGETAGRKRLHAFLKNGVQDYVKTNNNMGADKTSRLSAYLHFGCISAREIETMLPDNSGARAWHRQLCWRDFYHYILYNFPSTTEKEFQERYQGLEWDNDPKLLQAWKDGQTGYPIVDAAMRQLRQEGWMHNRGRLIVGCFLTKDLWLDWRLGEAYFMNMLLDGDTANNNGNWQWIASVGVDPAPVFRRMYNPTSQQAKFDPQNVYVRKYVPELIKVPDKYITEPWNMPKDIQIEANCIIGNDYPAPIVDHKEARLAALEHYRIAK